MTSLYVWFDWSSLPFVCSLFRYHPCYCFWFIIFVSPLYSFLTMTYSKFDTFFASFLRISLPVRFSLLPHYYYYIHIGHPQVHSSRDILYMLHFIHEGLGFDLRYLGLVFLHFYCLITSLHFFMCLKTTMRPWDQMSSSTIPTWTSVWDLVDA